MWKVKEKNKTFKVVWHAVKQYPDYNPVNKRCLLCLNEKLKILENESGNLNNKRSEIISKCRHRNKHMLNNLTSDQDNIT